MQNYMTECYSLYKRNKIATYFTFPGGEGGTTRVVDEGKRRRYCVSTKSNYELCFYLSLSAKSFVYSNN